MLDLELLNVFLVIQIVWLQREYLNIISIYIAHSTETANYKNDVILFVNLFINVSTLHKYKYSLHIYILQRW